ncbi:calcium-binding protein 2-like [Lampetra fluviatilis]
MGFMPTEMEIIEMTQFLPCMRTMGFMPTKMEIIEMTQCLQGGGVDFADFVELMKPKLLAESRDAFAPQQLQTAFRELDSNGDGALSVGELGEALHAVLGEPLSPRELAELLHDLDLNGDGRVSLQEFVKMMSLTQ